MKRWIVNFEQNGYRGCQGRLVAISYSEAFDKANEIINKMNKSCKDMGSNVFYTLESIRNYDAIEDWDSI